jgi:hypothetical protein
MTLELYECWPRDEPDGAVGARLHSECLPIDSVSVALVSCSLVHESVDQNVFAFQVQLNPCTTGSPSGFLSGAARSLSRQRDPRGRRTVVCIFRLDCAVGHETSNFFPVSKTSMTAAGRTSGVDLCL